MKSDKISGAGRPGSVGPLPPSMHRAEGDGVRVGGGGVKRQAQLRGWQRTVPGMEGGFTGG